MADGGAGVRVSIDVPVEPPTAFEVLTEELGAGLAAAGMRLQAGVGGGVFDGSAEVGRVAAWEPDVRIAVDWRSAASGLTPLEITFEAVDGGTRITVVHDGWGAFVEGAEMAAWFAREVTAPLLRATAPSTFGDWFTDRRARRPAGGQARANYRDPLYHYPSFRVVLAELALTAEDRLLDVGCGGGAFLKEALPSGCRAAGVDHSHQMVAVACDLNRNAIEESRLAIIAAQATALPLADGTFTCAAMHGVFGFLPDPVAALGEVHRVLLPGGRLIVLGSDPELKGTPACPEPIAARLNFYDEETLLQLGRDAGFEEVTVRRHNLESLARESGIPEEGLPIFSFWNPRFLVARRN